MSKIQVFCALFLTVLCVPTLFSKEESWDDTMKMDDTPSTSVERFYPRLIMMKPSVLFFEEGIGFSVDHDIAKQAVEEAYLYIQEYFAPKEGDDSFTRNNNALILQIIQQERSKSIAQVFARESNNTQYLFINVFPSRSIAGDQHRINNQMWRPKQATSPAFWRIRYDLNNHTFYAFNYDLVL